MDHRERGEFIRFLAKELKAYTRELMAYQLLVATLKVNGVVGLEKILQECRESKTLQKRLDDLMRPLEETLPPADQEYSEKVKELLLKWKPPSELLN